MPSDKYQSHIQGLPLSERNFFTDKAPYLTYSGTGCCGAKNIFLGDGYSFERFKRLCLHLKYFYEHGTFARRPDKGVIFTCHVASYQQDWHKKMEVLGFKPVYEFVNINSFNTVTVYILEMQKGYLLYKKYLPDVKTDDIEF